MLKRLSKQVFSQIFLQQGDFYLDGPIAGPGNVADILYWRKVFIKLKKSIIFFFTTDKLLSPTPFSFVSTNE
jgi:hypothetical protein